MQIEISNYVDGRFAPAHRQDRIEVFNPATEEVLTTQPRTDATGVEAAVAAATAAFGEWSRKPAIERAGTLRAIAQKIRGRAKELSETIVQEQGKIAGLAEVEVAFTADYLDYMAEWARRIEGEIITSDRPGENIFLFRQPIGVVGGILPWNFPFFLIARKLAPALVTGNTIVIKPSEETPINAFMFAELLHQAGLPKGVANFIFGDGAQTGAALAGSPGIDMISFTGSVQIGSAIMSAASRNITKVNLELGGKAPAIVMEDADLDGAVRNITDSRVINSGQVCNCAERIFVSRKVVDAFVEKLAKSMSGVTYGDPSTQKDVQMGPLINRAALDKVSAMVARATAQGAQVVTGGAAAEAATGAYYLPTVLMNCDSSWEIMQKEIFGPVLPVNVVDDLDEAIARANDSDYGLTSSIYTSDIRNVMKASNELRFGETYVNRENFEAMQGFHAGVRKSGIGGADGKHGLYEFTQTHAVYVQS